MVKSVALALLLLLGLSPLSAADRTLQPGLTHLYFDTWAGPRLSVFVYLPRDVDPASAPIMIMMHGAKRAAARYLSEWDQVADQYGFIVVAPEFAKTDYPKSNHYNLGNRHQRGSGKPIDETKWTFSAIEPIFDQVVMALGGSQQSYTLYGHSAGSQFVHRFMYFKPQARVKRFLAANAGWYTFPDFQTDYPTGLRNSGLTDSDLRTLLAKDVVILLGDQDNNPNHSSLRRGGDVDRQGPHRFARGQTFYRTAQAEANRLDTPFNWQLRIVPGVAHSNGGIAAAAGDLIQ